MFVYPSVCLSTCLCLGVCVSVYPFRLSVSISLSRLISVCLYRFMFLSHSLYLSICLPVYDYVSLCIYLSLCPSFYPSVFLSVPLTVFLPIYLSICLSVCLPISVCLSVYLPIYLSVFVSLTSDFLSISIPFCLSVLIKSLCPLVTLVWRLFSSFLMRWTSVGRMLAVCSSSIQILTAEWKISRHLLIGLTRVVYVPLTSICHL